MSFKKIHSIKLEIYRNLFVSIAEDMGTVLRRTAYSPNIKERRDYSCAIFDGSGELVSMGDHMPVHLGSMPLSVRAALESCSLNPGDVVMLNDPYSGGTHLPDITMVSAVYDLADTFSGPIAYLACRAHHSDVGGISPGSMSMSSEIFQEGIRIPPLKLYQVGRLNRDLLNLLLSNVRTPVEREGDLAAQVGSLRVGEKCVLRLLKKNGREELNIYMGALQDYTERIIRRLITKIPDGIYRAEDFLDSDGFDESSPVPEKRIKVSLEVKGEHLKVDFDGTDPQGKGCLNAVGAVTTSAVYYVLRCLSPEETPGNAGLIRPVKLVMSSGTIVNAQFPAATAGGNVETSQRIVDVLLRALSEALPDRIPAASSGTMSNLALGGINEETGRPFTYYETIGGGMGGGPVGDGDSGIQTHMTNSLNTPIEALEHDFPVRVREYRLRRGSGGSGRWRGGDGIVRTLEVLTDCHLSILSERHRYAPYGLRGGQSGKKGANYLIIKGRRKRLPGKVSIKLSKGQSISIQTAGGGGWGQSSRLSRSNGVRSVKREGQHKSMERVSIDLDR